MLNHFTTPQTNLYKTYLTMKRIYHHYDIWECFKNKKMYLTKDFNELKILKK
jgi:hypothetical protein